MNIHSCWTYLGLTFTPALSRPILSVHASRPIATNTLRTKKIKGQKRKFMYPLKQRQINSDHKYNWKRKNELLIDYIQCCTPLRWSHQFLWTWLWPSACLECLLPALQSGAEKEKNVQLSWEKQNGVTTKPEQCWGTSYLYRDILAEEFNAVFLHVLSCTVSHVLVKAPQQDGPHHNGDIKPQASQEAATLKCNVRCPNHQGLPRAVGQWEEVVTVGQTEDRVDCCYSAFRKVQKYMRSKTPLLKSNIITKHTWELHTTQTTGRLMKLGHLLGCVHVFHFITTCCGKRQLFKHLLNRLGDMLPPGDAVLLVSRDTQVAWPFSSS